MKEGLTITGLSVLDPLKLFSFPSSEGSLEAKVTEEQIKENLKNQGSFVDRHYGQRTEWGCYDYVRSLVEHLKEKVEDYENANKAYSFLEKGDISAAADKISSLEEYFTGFFIKRGYFARNDSEIEPITKIIRNIGNSDEELVRLQKHLRDLKEGLKDYSRYLEIAIGALKEARKVAGYSDPSSRVYQETANLLQDLSAKLTAGTLDNYVDAYENLIKNDPVDPELEYDLLFKINMHAESYLRTDTSRMAYNKLNFLRNIEIPIAELLKEGKKAGIIHPRFRELVRKAKFCLVNIHQMKDKVGDYNQKTKVVIPDAMNNNVMGMGRWMDIRRWGHYSQKLYPRGKAILNDRFLESLHIKEKLYISEMEKKFNWSEKG